MMTNQFEELLKDVWFRLATLKEARNRFSNQLAPEFRVFDYLRTDEMGLSRCIADLLDPNGKHGQKNVFLDTFLTRIGADWATSTEDCVVNTEKKANGQRRIDIFLELPKGVIGIENKPWACCQDNQLTDYANYMENSYGSKAKKWLLVFLSNRSPEEKSITQKSREKLENERQFVQCNYSDIIDWLEACSCKSRAPVVRVFIEELAKFIRTNINGEVEMSDEEEISRAVLKNHESLSSAIQIVKAMDNIKKELLEKFRNDLEASLKEKNLILDWNINSWQAYTGFNIQCSNKEQNFSLRFEFDRTGLNGFFWGIRRLSDDIYSDAVVWQNVNKLMSDEFYSGKSSQWWPWYSMLPNNEFDIGLKDWSISEKPWCMIMNGELVPKIIEIADRVCKAKCLLNSDCLQIETNQAQRLQQS